MSLEALLMFREQSVSAFSATSGLFSLKDSAEYSSSHFPVQLLPRVLFLSTGELTVKLGDGKLLVVTASTVVVSTISLSVAVFVSSLVEVVVVTVEMVVGESVEVGVVVLTLEEVVVTTLLMSGS